MLAQNLLKNRQAGDLSPNELGVLESAISEVRTFEAGEVNSWIR